MNSIRDAGEIKGIIGKMFSQKW